MTLFAVVYRYVDDDELITSHRPEHRKYLQSLAAAGELVVAGPLGEPGLPGGLLVLDVASLARAADIAHNDPFRRHGVIADQSVRSWTLSIGTNNWPHGVDRAGQKAAHS